MSSQVRIVGLGASAGGLAALEVFFKSIPTDTGMAFVVIQHLSQDHESHLADLLNRVTDMPVRTLEKDLLPEPNSVYVRPPNQNIMVDQGLHMIPRPQEQQIDLAIDDFFLSLASSRESQALAVILSGMGSDGSRGAAQIRENGGLVFVQSPESAQFDGMPRSAINFNAADIIGTPRELAQKLAITVKKERELLPEIANDKEEQTAYGRLEEYIFRVARENIGVDFSQYRPTTIRRRIDKRMLILQLDGYGEYLALLRTDEEEAISVARSFLIGVTRFMRNPELFDLLSDKYIPQLLDQLPPERVLRVWVPSCSTGEEAYSYAILIAEQLRLSNSNQDFKILASDVDQQSLFHAGKGVYPLTSVSNMPADLLERYFAPVLGGYQIKPRLREKILFAPQNLLSDPPFIHVHLVSCRNFLIYVNPKAQSDILANFHFALDPGGIMVLGPSEGPGRLHRAFTTLNRRWKIFGRKSQENVRFPIRARSQVVSAAGQNNMATPPPKLGHTVFPVAELNPNQVFDHYAQYLSERYAPIALFLDENYIIQYFNGKVDELLHFPRNFAQLSLERVIEKDVGTVIVAAIDELTRRSEETTEELFISLSSQIIRGHTYNLRIGRVSILERDTQLFIVEFWPSAAGHASQIDSEGQEQTELLRFRIQSLEDKLLQARQHGQKLLVELEATNEELQTSNRELMAANEEMQSTNEELQSVNEELYSVNSEIQRKNEQLKWLNKDMTHLLESTEIGTIFLDGNLNITRFTPTIRLHFDLFPSDIGRPLSSFSGSFGDLNLAQLGEKVLNNRKRIEREVTNENGNNYLLRILPYKDSEDKMDGLIITFVDISDLVATRRKLAAMAQKYETIFTQYADMIIIVGETGRILEANHWLGEKTEGANLVGTYFVDLLADSEQMVKFNNVLRKVVDLRTVQQVRLQTRSDIEVGTRWICATLYPVEIKATAHDGKELQVVMVIRDESEQVREKERYAYIMSEYIRSLKTTSNGGGLMQPDGTIMEIVPNPDEDEITPAEDTVQTNTYDYLSPTGQEKLRNAIVALSEGSREVVVNYAAKDFSELYPSEELTVKYEPIISGGQLILILVTRKPAN